MSGNCVLMDGIMTLLQMMLLICKVVLLLILKVPRLGLSVLGAAAAGTATRAAAL